MKEGGDKMNKQMLKSIMTLHGERIKDLARVIGVTPQTCSDKINERNGAEFKQGEIKAIARHYKMTEQQLIAIFFTE